MKTCGKRRRRAAKSDTASTPRRDAMASCVESMREDGGLRRLPSIHTDVAVAVAVAVAVVVVVVGAVVDAPVLNSLMREECFG
jgi:hypothetical protein